MANVQRSFRRMDFVNYGIPVCNLVCLYRKCLSCGAFKSGVSLAGQGRAVLPDGTAHESRLVWGCLAESMIPPLTLRRCGARDGSRKQRHIEMA